MPPRCLFLTLLPLGLALADEPTKVGSLTEAQGARLHGEKLVVTQEEFRQSFSPYIDGTLPVFVTSDAVLNAFHVLLAEAVSRMACRQVGQLPHLLDTAWENLPTATSQVEGNDALRDAAARRARLVLGVARALAGLPLDAMAADERDLVVKEAATCEKAEGQGMPPWLGAPKPSFLGIDYTRFKPRGFYVSSPRLERFFRAVTWLQAIPFSTEDDTELLAALLLGRTIQDEGENRAAVQDAHRLLESGRAFVGWPDDPDWLAAMDAGSRGEATFEIDAPKWRASVAVALAREWAPARVNDQLALPPSDGQTIAPLQFRLWGAAALPDARLFQSTTDARNGLRRQQPAALEVAALAGCGFALDQLPPSVRQFIPARRETARERDLYSRHFACLEALVDAPEPDAPSFMSGVAWQRKSCATVLGAWAQMRRTFVLQAKSSITFAGYTELEPGFVEPDPAFWLRLHDLEVHTMAALEAAGAFTGEPAEAVMHDLERTLALVRDSTEMQALTAAEYGEFFRGVARLRRAGEHVTQEDDDAGSVDAEPEATSAAKRRVDAEEEENRQFAASAAKALARLRRLPPDELEQAAQEFALPEETSLRDRWFGLVRITARIEALAQKQLRQQAFTEPEREFMRTFGVTLAAAMFYDGNSYESPLDDAMKVIDVFTGPQGHWHVGIGRPRALHVLYPWKGQEIHCLGAVLPFLETTEPAPLDDAAWKAKLSGPAKQRPELPTWYAPLAVEKR